MSSEAVAVEATASARVDDALQTLSGVISGSPDSLLWGAAYSRVVFFRYGGAQERELGGVRNIVVFCYFLVDGVVVVELRGPIFAQRDREVPCGWLGGGQSKPEQTATDLSREWALFTSRRRARTQYARRRRAARRPPFARRTCVVPCSWLAEFGGRGKRRRLLDRAD